MIPVDDCISAYGVEGLLKLILDNSVMSPTGLHEQVDGSLGSQSSVNTYTAGDVVRLVSINNSAAFEFGPGAVTATNIYLPPDTPEYFHIEADTLITVIGAIVDITVME